MGEEKYNARKFALSLGFSEAEAETLKNADATNIRRIAISNGLMVDPNKPKVEKPQTEPAKEPVPEKPHRHSYRKDGTCKCGAVKVVKAEK